jgi:hypothetical protein
MLTPYRLCVCESPFLNLNGWTYLRETWYLYRDNSVHLNNVYVPQKQDRKFQTAAFRQEVISGHKSHKGKVTSNINPFHLCVLCSCVC